MAKGHPGIPKITRRVVRKVDIIKNLRAIDHDREATNRILRLESAFRRKIEMAVGALPANDASFERFSTSPFVVVIHALRNKYAKVSELERDILPAKLFSSLETSAGKMVELVALPVYGWNAVPSEMHTTDSALDGKCLDGKTLRLVTLKSGPRCLNDEMSENFADTIVEYAPAWAKAEEVEEVDFTYGVLYGTPRQSNKKDWHILRNIKEKIEREGLSMDRSPTGRWDCRFTKDGVNVSVSVRIGTDWWSHLGGATCLTEICVALIRACVRPGEQDADDYQYQISDLAEIVSTEALLSTFNVSVLQRSQIPWLFFLMRHFADSLARLDRRELSSMMTEEVMEADG